MSNRCDQGGTSCAKRTFVAKKPKANEIDYLFSYWEARPGVEESGRGIKPTRRRARYRLLECSCEHFTFFALRCAYKKRAFALESRGS